MIVLFGASAWQREDPIFFAMSVVASVLLVTLAWPLLILLDRMNRRNVWVYPDRVLITHARDRVVVRRSELKQVYLYRLDKPPGFALEFLSTTGESNVVGLPSEVEPRELLTNLCSVGYQVESDL